MKKTILFFVAVIILMITGVIFTACKEDDVAETPEYYNLSCYMDGSAGEVTEVSVKEGENYQIAVPRKDGYTLIGFFDSFSGGTKYVNPNGYSVNPCSGENTLYAQWMVNTYTLVFYDSGDGTTELNTLFVAYDEKLKDVPTLNLPEGNELVGLYSSPESTEKQYADKKGWKSEFSTFNFDTFGKPNKNNIIGIYVRYSRIECTINYYDNAVLWQSITVPYGTVINSEYRGQYVPTISKQESTYKTLNGWSTRKDSKGKVFDGEITSSIDLYAKWDYKIIFELSEGEIFSQINSETTIIQTVDSFINLPSVQKEGMRFVGWKLGNETLSDVMPSMGGVAKAMWKIIEYSITYNYNGGNCEITPPTKYTIEGTGLPTLEKSDYRFCGWYKNETFEGEGLYDITKGTTGNLTLYARFKYIYLIEYNLDGGKNSTSNPLSYCTGDQINFLPAEKKEYRFCGWYNNNGFKGEAISSQTMETTGEVTLYAKFVPLYLIQYNLDGGKNSILNPLSYYTGDQVTFFPAEKTGYKFLGWFSTDGNKVEMTSTFTQEGQITLSAHWEAKKFTVTYINGNEGLGSKIVTFGELYGSLPSPIQDNCLFYGWYTETNETKIDRSITVSTAQNHNLYAMWEYKIIFNDNCKGNMIDTGTTQSYVANGSTMPKISVPSSKYYKFEGYYDTQGNDCSASGKQYYDKNGSFTRTYDDYDPKTLYAKWTKKAEYADYYYVSTNAELNNIRNNAAGKYLLIKDITLTETWTPIPSLSGVLDGDGNTISGMIINIPTGSKSSNVYYGLFALSIGTVKNLIVTDASINMPPISTNHDGNGFIFAGVICGTGFGSISHCTVKNSSVEVHRTKSEIGGIAGDFGGTIDNCTSAGLIIYGNGCIGGIVGGLAGTGRVESCTLTSSNERRSTVKYYCMSGSSAVGGIVGFNNGGSVKLVNASYTDFLCTNGDNPGDDVIMAYIIGKQKDGSAQNLACSYCTYNPINPISWYNRYYFNQVTNNYDGKIGRCEGGPSIK